MNTQDRADAQTLATRRVTRGLLGETDFDVPAAPPLRGIAWGVLVALLIAIVLFASVLVANNRKTTSNHSRSAATVQLVRRW